LCLEGIRFSVQSILTARISINFLMWVKFCLKCAEMLTGKNTDIGRDGRCCDTAKWQKWDHAENVLRGAAVWSALCSCYGDKSRSL